MKRFQGICLFVLACTLTVALAQVSVAQERELAASPAPAHRVSMVIGMSVTNATGENLGKINDLVMDNAGQVRYAAVSFGGTLGYGKKLFAVPFRVLALKSSPSAQNYYAELNVEKSVLEKAPGFPSDKWPNFGDESFTKEIDSFYLLHSKTVVKTPRP